MQAQAGVSIPFDPAFDQDKEIGPDGLRAGIAAPDPAKRRGKEEKAQPRHDQKARDEVELMRPDFDPEEEETTAGQIDQHGLIRQVRAPVPADPGREVIDAQGDRHDHPFQISERPVDLLGKNRLAGRIEALRRVGLAIGHGITPAFRVLMMWLSQVAPPETLTCVKF